MLFKEEFFDLLEKNGIQALEQHYSRFACYNEELVEWNKKVNLTAITDDYGVAVKHFIDSLILLKLVNIPENARIIDVGTGAGFPGVPLRLVRPDLQLTLLDSLDKRLNFLRHLQVQLGFDAVTVHARAEDAGRLEQHREQYDIATSRAVASMAELAEYCLPLVKVGGRVLALKGSSGREEARQGENSIKTCGGEVEQIIDYQLPNGDPRTLVVVKKVSPTPPKYPRNSGQIAKRPL